MPSSLTQLNQQPKQRNRIDPTRNRNPNPVPGPQQFLPPDMGQHALRQFMHANMVQPGFPKTRIGTVETQLSPRLKELRKDFLCVSVPLW